MVFLDGMDMPFSICLTIGLTGYGQYSKKKFFILLSFFFFFQSSVFCDVTPVYVSV